MARSRTARDDALSGQPFSIILESISDGVFTVDESWRVTSFNRAAETITGIPRAQAVGRPCWEVFRASLCERDCALRRTFATGRPVVGRSAFIVRGDGERLPISVSTAVLRDAQGRVIGGAETFRDLSAVEELRKELSGRFEIGDFVSRSPAMRRLFDVVLQVAASDCTVLIQGETGTGKELLARALHNAGRRRGRPFIAVNCAALPETLLESELFGYRAGAFTGAQRDKPGRFALAEAGTLFLDEIGDMPPSVQVKLLRVLQDGTYDVVGGIRTVRADVRVVAATHRDLERRVEEGSFRADLYYRINVVKIEIPPLRERREDVPLLVDHFVARLNRLQGRRSAASTPRCWACSWPTSSPATCGSSRTSSSTRSSCAKGTGWSSAICPRASCPAGVRAHRRSPSVRRRGRRRPGSSPKRSSDTASTASPAPGPWASTRARCSARSAPSASRSRSATDARESAPERPLHRPGSGGPTRRRVPSDRHVHR
jgi:PAS domain S-box-containing protein